MQTYGPKIIDALFEAVEKAGENKENLTKDDFRKAINCALTCLNIKGYNCNQGWSTVWNSALKNNKSGYEPKN